MLIIVGYFDVVFILWMYWSVVAFFPVISYKMYAVVDNLFEYSVVCAI